MARILGQISTTCIIQLASITRCLDFLEKDPEHSIWAREMKMMLSSEHCENWRAHYLQPRRSRLHGFLQRTTAQESAGAIVNAHKMIKQARDVLTNNVQEELAGLKTNNAPSSTISAAGSGQTRKGKDDSIKNMSDGLI